MELVRIPIAELDKVWSIVDKDIKNALAYSGQLTNSEFCFRSCQARKIPSLGFMG